MIKLSYILKDRRRLLLIGSVIILVIVLGYSMLSEPASVLYTTGTNSVYNGFGYNVEITYDKPYDIRSEAFGSKTYRVLVFPSSSSTINFQFTVVAKKPYQDPDYDPLGWIHVYLSPSVQSFDTGYLTDVYEWGDYSKTSTTIYLRYTVTLPNKAGVYYWIFQASPVSMGSTYAGLLKWYFELTGSSTTDPLIGYTWNLAEESSTKEVTFTAGEPVIPPTPTTTTTTETDTTTTTTNGNGDDNGNGNGLTNPLPAFELPVLLITLIIGVKYVKKKFNEN